MLRPINYLTNLGRYPRTKAPKEILSFRYVSPYIPSNLLTTPLIFPFTTFPRPNTYQTLNTSEFAKQVGLSAELRKVTKNSRQHEKQTFRVTATIVSLLMIAFGTYVFVNVIDANQMRLWGFWVGRWRGYLKVDRKKGEEETERRNVEHERNLKEIFVRNFSDRSIVDAKFLKYLASAVSQKIGKIKKTNNGGRIDEKRQYQLSEDLVYVIDRIVEKLETLPQQKTLKNWKSVLSIVQNLIFHELSSINSSSNLNHSLISNSSLSIQDDPNTNFPQKLSKFLLLKGDLNQQLLGLKYLQEQGSIAKLSEILSIQDVEEVRCRIAINKEQHEKSMKLPRNSSLPSLDFSSTQGDQQEDPESISSRIVQVKEQLLYSIQQLKQLNEIKRSKFGHLKETLDQIMIEKEKIQKLNVNQQDPKNQKKK